MPADLSTYKVASAETSDAAKFDALVQAIQDALNSIGDTTKMGWAGGEILALSQLSQSGAGAGQVPQWNGSAWAAATLGSSTVPAGVVVPYAAGSAPSGWLLCDGTAVSRTTYSVLFAAIGTSYGVGDGSTTFNVPDFRGRVPVGYASAGHLDVSVLGNNDGTALANRRPKHQHTVYDPGHTHLYGSNNIIAEGAGTLKPAPNAADNFVASASATTGVKVNPEGAASSSSPSNAPAYLVIQMIVKT